jgi:hypothetical protein
MASTYSGNLAIELIGTGDQAGTWGITTNTNLGTTLEQAITSTASVTFIAGGNSAIALAQDQAFQAARSYRLTLAGSATATQYLWVPAINKSYVVRNGLSNAIIISNGSNGAGTGTTVTVPSGRSMIVYNDATNIVEVLDYITTLTAGRINVANNVIITGNLTVSGNTTITGNVSVSNLSLTTVLPISSGGTGANSATYALTNLTGFTNTATAGGTTTLSNTSSFYQLFTGTQTQTVVLPVTSTLTTGWTFHICNNSTANIAVNSSGANLVINIVSNATAMVTCIQTSGTTEASWEFGLTDFSTSTGSGSVVLNVSPTLANATINAYTESVIAVGNTGNVQTFNISNSTIVTATLTANCTWTMPSNTAGKSFILLLKTGNGGFTSSFTNVKWPGNTAPTITSSNNSLDILTFIADGANWYGNYAQGYIP